MGFAHTRADKETDWNRNGRTTHNLVVNIRKIKMHMGTGRNRQHGRRTGMEKIRSPRISQKTTRGKRYELKDEDKQSTVDRQPNPHVYLVAAA